MIYEQLNKTSTCSFYTTQLAKAQKQVQIMAHSASAYILKFYLLFLFCNSMHLITVFLLHHYLMKECHKFTDGENSFGKGK